MRTYNPTEQEWEDPDGQPLSNDEPKQWSEKQRKKAKSALYGIADSLDQAGVPVEQVCRFLALYGQQIGDPHLSYSRWEDRAYLWADGAVKKIKRTDDESA